MTYVASFAISLGPIFWLLNAEIYPLSVRSKAAGRGDDGELDLQLHRLAHLPAADRSRSAAAAPSGSTARSASSPSPSAGSSCRRPRANTSRTSRRTSRPGWTRRRRAHGRNTRGSSGGGYPARMRIDEIIAARTADLLGRVLPAEDGGGDRAAATRRRGSWRALEPDFVSVTYGAGGSTRDGTVEITKALKDELGFETMAHLSCVGETTEGLAGDPGPDRGGGDRERLRAARRPAARARRTSSSPRAGSAAPPSWPPSSPPAGTSRSAAPASRRCTPRRPTSRPTSPT